ncbi:MAG: CRISPR-associated endonuclease Cas1 [Candidatus Thiodiazotropha taylori]|nr:CRISPR-associated endonuclease Cas1 [Candidatus Thiodiazotropha endolucinida]MCW4228247.1 CRISPR-associated endonuclease Cas1 [Candidatus Thiodiazotropha taylori]
MAKSQRKPISNLESDNRADCELDSPCVTYEARSRYWLNKTLDTGYRRRRDREKNPLILTGHGLSLRVEKGSLSIRDGNTHFPAEQRHWRFFNGGLDIPPAIVIVDGSGEITLDAMDWLARQSVQLIRLRWDGQFSSVLSSGGQAASIEKILWQQETRKNPELRAEFGLKLLIKKARNTLATMEEYVPRSRIWDKAYQNISTQTHSLVEQPPKDFQGLLGVEGAIASEYFRSWSAIPIKWKATKQCPIPDDWRKFTSRAAVRSGRPRAYQATHPINAMLNYAYGILTARTEIKLIVDGYDPTIGIMHDDKETRGRYPAFALDTMEPLRPVVDRVVLQLVGTMKFTGNDFLLQHDGVCRLNTELARRLAQLVLESLGTMDDIFLFA